MRTLTLDSSVTKNIKKTITLLSLFFAASLYFSVHAKTKGIRLKTAPPVYKERRTALVIGNAAYESDPLTNPVNDARAMEKTLMGMGFSVKLLENASRRQMEDNIESFGEKLSEIGGVGLFYFSGHGMQVENENYLIPVGGKITNEKKVKYNAVNAGLLVESMESANKTSMNIIILDACRNNPFIKRKYRDGKRGLAPYLNTPEGTIIAYATAPGSVADDGEEESGFGLYTGELIRHMKKPGLRIIDVFRKVRAGVLEKSNGKQKPMEFSNLMPGAFYLVRPLQNGGEIEKTYPAYEEEDQRNIMVFFKKHSDNDLEDLMQNSRSKIYSGINSLVESIKSVNLKGFSEISTEDNFHRNLETMMTEKGSNSSLVFSTESIFQEDSESSMWEGTVLMNISIDSYLFKQDGLTKTGSYSIERQRIPIGKWGSSNSFKKKHLQRITDKVIKKWSDENITNFIQSIK